MDLIFCRLTRLRPKAVNGYHFFLTAVEGEVPGVGDVFSVARPLVPRVIGQTAEAESRKGTNSSTARQPPRTEQELQEIADTNKVGDVYRVLVHELRSQFDSVGTSRSTLRFEGIGPNGASRLAMVSLFPGESDSNKGVQFAVWVDRIAEYVDCDRQEVLSVLPQTIRLDPYENGETATGNVKAAADFAPLTELLATRVNAQNHS